MRGVDLPGPARRLITRMTVAAIVDVFYGRTSSFATSIAKAEFDRSLAPLEQKLIDIYQNRPQKVIFVKADPDIVYQDVIAAMDAARAAGVKVIGAVLPEQEKALGL